MRVLVTRPEIDAEGTVAALTKRGHVAVLAPVMAIRPLPAELPPGPCDALAATSRHAFANRGAGLDRALPVYAVGRRTAEAARTAGFRDLRIGAGDARGLADLLRLTLPRSARILYLAAQDRKPILEAALSQAGYAITVVETYAADAAADWPADTLQMLRDGALDAALHYSRRSAELALALAGKFGLADTLLNLRHVCLSADCAEPLKARGAARVAVADRPEDDALLALLDAERR